MINLIEIEVSIKKLNRLFAFLVIPVLGIIIPNMYGIISNALYKWWQLLLSYLYFIFVSLVIWKGNMVFFRRIRQKYEQRSLAYFKMLSWYLSVNLVYSGCITVVLLWAWQAVSKDAGFDRGGLLHTGIVVMVSVVIINNIYEIVLLRKEMEKTIVEYKRMEIAKMHAELEALKAQIDPHFIFNSLNTLSYLITNKPETAKFYNETLAKVYRYILLNKDKDLVFLKDEIEFISNYFYLIKIRFDNAVNMIIEIPDVNAENYLITPISLQMLIENAIKHNYFTGTHPLVIRITIQSYFVVVRNRIKQKEFQVNSPGIGLKNLKERYQLIMKKNIIVHSDAEEFTVKVPILKA